MPLGGRAEIENVKSMEHFPKLKKKIIQIFDT